MKKLFFVFSILFLFVFVGVAQVDAQRTGIRISPVRIEELVEPGQVLTRSVKVKNESVEDRQLFVYLRDFEADGEGGKPKLIVPGSAEGQFLASWIEVPEANLEFNAGEEREVFFNINVPKEVGPGGYYGAVVFGSQPPKLRINSEDKGAGMTISQQATTLLLFQVKGDAVEAMSVREFVTDKTVYNTPFDISFATRLENKGNVHTRPMGTIEIKNFFGKTVKEIKFNDKGSNVLPKTKRQFSDSWTGEKGLGPYRAILGLSYGTSPDDGGKGKQSLYGEYKFWIMPWRLLLIVGAIVFTALILFWLFLRFYKEKAIQKAMEKAGIKQSGRSRRSKNAPSPTAHLFVIFIFVLLAVLFIFATIYLLFLS